jgi:hypothetical protein
MDEQVKFMARGDGYTLFLTSTEAVFSLNKTISATTKGRVSPPSRYTYQNELYHNEQSILRMQLIGANPDPMVTGLGEFPGEVNYFIGSDSKSWQKNIDTYSKVEYKEVYPGIDLLYYGDNKNLEYDFLISPGANPEAIIITFQGIDHLEIDRKGDLILWIEGEQFVQRVPTIYQESDGARREISGGYIHRGLYDIGFRIGDHDPELSLIIDPELIYSSYFGGSGTDTGFKVAQDEAGNIYLVGTTNSTNFPTENPIQSSLSGNDDIFVTKIDPDGSQIIYSTYLGGSGKDGSGGAYLAVNSYGDVWITGETRSADFPIFNAYQSVYRGGISDNFISKISHDGSTLLYSTYFGGNDFDVASDIEVDPDDIAWVTGYTKSANFPLMDPIQSTLGGNADVFVTAIKPDGSGPLFSTFLGGIVRDAGDDIYLTASGSVFVVGQTNSIDFPIFNALQPDHGSPNNGDGFVTKIKDKSLIFSTFLGGNGGDVIREIDLDSYGDLYVTGQTESSNFPTINAVQPLHNGYIDAFVTKIDSTGSTLLYSTYLGGIDTDAATCLVVDSDGYAYVTGQTDSSDFQIINPIQDGYGGGGRDIFITKLTPTGSEIVFSSYLGGSAIESPSTLVLDSNGNIIMIGATGSTDFPTLNALQPTFGGGSDAFLVMITDPPPNHPPIANAGLDQTVILGDTVELNGSNSSDPDDDPISHHWEFEIIPAGSTATLDDPSIVYPTFVADLVGDYIIQLIVNDGVVNSDPDQVIITAQTPQEAIEDLINTVESFNLQQGISNSLDAKLEVAIRALDDLNENNDAAAVSSLQAFINAVEAQSGKELTEVQADELINIAQTIINSLLS